MNKKLALFLCVFFQVPVYGIMIQGDPASTPGINTFSFPLFDALYNQQNATMWTFNSANIAAASSRPYGISSILDGATSAIAQTSTQATITTTSGTNPIVSTGANPFYGGSIGLASLWTPSSAGRSALPACVLFTDNTNLYAFSNIIMADDTSSLYKFTAPGSRTISGLQGLSGSLWYVASDPITGIPDYVGFLVETPSAGNVKYLSEADRFAFAGTSSYLKQGGTNLVINSELPSLCVLGDNMYVGLDVRGGGATSGGAAGFFTVINAGYTITPRAILPSNGNGQNTVLSVATNADLLIIYDLQIMNTSTGLSYLIINKYSNNSGVPTQGVYAVPIVTNGSSANYGVVAQYTPGGTDIAITSDPTTNMILKKGFANPLTNGTLTQIETAGTPPASLTVGGAFPSAAAFLNNLSVVGDAVYVATNVGTYFSKALFDQYGGIAGWTPWQITHAATWANNGNNQSSGIIDGNTGKGWFSQSPGAGNSIVQRTEWNNNTTLASVQTAISGNLSGNLVQNVFDLPASLPVFSGAPFSGSVYTGKNKVIAAQTGNNGGAGSAYYPVNPVTSVTTVDATALGHIVAFEIGVDTTVTPHVSWAFAAGQNGIGVSSTGVNRGGLTPNGSGGPSPFNNTIAGLLPSAFTLIAQLPYVKKLQTATPGGAGASFLYALNSQGLYSIRLDVANFSAPTIVATTPVFLASSLGPNVAFTDFIASTSNTANVQFVVGTTQGLYVGQNDGSGVLTQVQLPSIQSVQRLIPQADLSTVINNLYVVAGDFANDQTEIVRFFLLDFGHTLNPSIALLPFQDQTYVGVNKPFVTMSNFQNTFWWQGSCGLFGMSGRLGSLNPIVKILKSGVTGSMSSNQSIWMYFLSTLSIPGIASSTYLTTTLQDSAYGALQLGGGDFGLQALT